MKKVPRPPIVPEGQKFCTACLSCKPVEAFGRDKTRKDGLAAWCKACLNAYTSQKQYIPRQAYFHRRKVYGSNLLEVPIGATSGELKEAVRQRALRKRDAA